MIKNRFPLPDGERGIVNILLSDMNAGLKNLADSDEDMSLTWMLPPADPVKNERVIVIDAGGTNFRSCLVSFDAQGKAAISDFKKTVMPGVQREYSKTEFFEAIADNIDYLKNKASRIGFCFSYSMTITKDGDGIPNAFSKEIKAAEVVGCPVGSCLKAELEKRGWKVDHIALLNDTVAALLAGAAGSEEGVEYSSYVGFILGTGMNGAYIQPEKDFGLMEAGEGLTAQVSGGYRRAGASLIRHVERQIVVCESGKTAKFSRSVFDETLDKKSQHPGDYQLEKCCSGAYLGPLALEVLHAACDEKELLSAQTALSMRSLEHLSLIEMDEFLYAPFKKGVLSECIQSDEDRSVVFELLDSLIDRCAWYAASILCACVVQGGGGRDASKPVCILCNGTTFYKTHHLKSRIEGYLNQLLWKERGLFYEIVSKEDDITLGTAIAGLL